MTHYSQKLKNSIDAKEARIQLAKKTVQEFRKHLESSKFHNDTTIQVKDVNLWLLQVLFDLDGMA